jgi:hypothetical protein
MLSRDASIPLPNPKPLDVTPTTATLRGLRILSMV